MLSLGLVLLVLVMTILVVQYVKLQSSRSRFPPGPTPLPFFGNLWTLGFQLHHETLMELAETYGNIFTVWLGHEPVIVLNGCQAVRDGLIAHSKELSGRPRTPFSDEVSKGKGVLFTSGHNWLQLRRFAQKTLWNLGLGKKSLESRIQVEAQFLADLFSTNKGNAVDPSDALLHSVTNVIAAVAFGHQFSSDDKDFLFLRETNKLITGFTESIWIFHAFPWLMRLLPGTHQKIFKYYTLMQIFVTNEIKSHKEKGVPAEPQDIIDFYLTHMSTAYDNAMSLYDDDNMIQLLVELFIAGVETTTTTLRWALLHMVTQPEIQERVHKELDTVLGECHNIQYEDRKRLPYTNAVIHEIQRYSNIASTGLYRQVVKDISLQGFNIEKGTILLANLSSSLYDPDHWRTPRQFNPGHFLDTDGNFMKSDAFVPFSAGHRVCLGEQLARIELFLFFTSLLQAFTFSLPEDVMEVNMDYIHALTLQPHPYQICAVPR